MRLFEMRPGTRTLCFLLYPSCGENTRADRWIELCRGRRAYLQAYVCTDVCWEDVNVMRCLRLERVECVDQLCPCVVLGVTGDQL